MYHTVNEESIGEMVDTFYAKVRDDRLLGSIFAGKIGDDWNPHLQKMKAFWATVLLASRTYKGNPMIAHLQLPRLSQHHFGHWLELWRETGAELCSPAVADLFLQKAEMIGQRLLHTITMYHESVSSQGVHV